jgi:alkylhydroperoxidase/carboxymuconolactone decarboxylase family protein YurZ
MKLSMLLTNTLIRIFTLPCSNTHVTNMISVPATHPYRGLSLFQQIYAHHTSRILTAMSNSYPDLAYTAIHHIYGGVLSETTILNARETSLIAVAGLIPLDCPSQLKGHLGGARNNGATEEDLRRVTELVKVVVRQWGSVTEGSVKASL